MTRLIEASAGTRKTTRLVGAVLEALLVEGVPVERLCAITFTEKAAAEMRMRLAKALKRVRSGEKVEEWDATLEDWASEHGRDAAEVRRSARKAWRAIDRAFVGTFHSLAMRLLRLHPREAGVPPVIEADEGGGFDAMFEEEWRAWFGGQMERPDGPWGGLLARMGPQGLEGLAHALASFRTPDALIEDAGYSRNLRAEARGILKDAAAALDAIPDPARKAEAMVAKKAQYSEVLQAATTGRLPDALVRRMRTWKAAGYSLGTGSKSWSEDEHAAAKEGEALARRAIDLDDPLIAEAVTKLAPFVRDFRRRYLSRGFVTFDGMVALARRLLGHREVRERVKAMFDRIFVDEFQDTDPQQYEIVLALAERAGRFAADWRKIEVDPSRLVVVGDPKQSIYSFRGADLEAYEAVKAKLADKVERPAENYRSCPEIVKAVNAVFEGLFEGYEPLRVAKPKPWPKDPCARFVKVDAEGRVDDRAEAEAAWVAAEVAKSKRARGGTAILLRKLTRAHVFMEALRRRDVPYVIEGDKNFFQQPEVLDLFNLLRAAADPADRAAEIGVLRSPVGGMTDAEIFEGKRDAPIFGVLADLRSMAGRIAPADLVREVFLRTSLLAAARGGARGDIAVANLFKVRELARRATAAADGTLKGFLRDLLRAIREWVEEAEDPLADEDGDAVRIMSVHKAKGLDFDVVYVPLLFEGVGNKEDAVCVRVRWATGECAVSAPGAFDLPTLAMDEREERVRREEAERLLYVAMTRAKDRMILVGAFHEKSPADSFAALLRKSEAKIEWEEAAAPKAPARKPRRRKAPIDRKVLEKRWKRIDDLAGKAAAKVEAPSELVEEPVAQRSEIGAAIGSVCHAVLEGVSWERALAGAPAGVEDPARNIIQAFEKSDAAKRLAKAKVLAREVPFVAGGRNGRIDVLYEEGGAIVVGDYKTDAVETARDLIERHREQMKAYVEAVKRKFPGRTVEAALIWLPRGEIVPLQG